MTEYRNPKGDYIEVQYQRNHPSGTINSKAFIFCDCSKLGECNLGTKHAGADPHKDGLIMLRKETNSWMLIRS